MRSWCVFVKLILALIRIQLFWSSFMNIECPYIRPSSHSSNSWSRSWLDEGVEECEPWRETGWKRCNPAPGCRHKLPKFDKISFTQSIQLTLVHSPQRQILDPLESQLRAWAGPSWVTDFRAASREQGWSSFLVSPSWKIFCKTFFHSSHHVWCHRNLTPLLVSVSARLLTQDPGLMFDWNVYPGLLGLSEGASWKSQAETRHGLHNLCGGLSLVSWHYWGWLLCGYPWQWQHSRDSGDSLTLYLLRLAEFLPG